MITDRNALSLLAALLLAGLLVLGLGFAPAADPSRAGAAHVTMLTTGDVGEWPPAP